MPNINIFNTTNENLTLNVNTGAPFTIPGAGQNGQPNFNSAPFNLSNPSPGGFGIGSNHLMVTSGGSSQVITINIPYNMQIRSLQLYIFTGNSGTTWVLLESGRLVAMNTPQFGSSGATQEETDSE
jgi:hypothetical protein